MPGTHARSRGIWGGEVGATGRKNRSPLLSCAGPTQSGVSGPPDRSWAKGAASHPEKIRPILPAVLKGGIWLLPPEEIPATEETLPPNYQTPISTETRPAGGSRPGEVCEGTGSSQPPTLLLQGTPERGGDSPFSSFLPLLQRSSEPGWGFQPAWSES